MTRIASGTYLAQLIERASVPSDDIERTLQRNGSWSGWSEWRIGTVTEERIERVPEGYQVSSACDLRFTARVKKLEDALVARKIFAQLHADLFYGFGWPGWAGYMRMNAGDAAGAPHSAEADPYLVQLFDRSREQYEPRFGEIDRAIEQGGVWAERGTKIRSTEGYPGITAEAAEPLQPEPWFEGRVRHTTVEVRWKSRTLERAAVFVGLLDQLLADLAHAGAWSRPPEESTG